jgi:Protein of unknown function (DUF3747)
LSQKSLLLLNQGGAHKLVILEQVSSKKKCWEANGSKPTKVELLLLKFDFTGICGRSMDSNGYSIRQKGKDLALDYNPVLKKRGKDLILMGAPRPGRQSASIEIGRTLGMSANPMKIVLNSGWRLTRRTYNGKPLGHIYLTSDQP